MSFVEWLKYQKISETTIKKYNGALIGVISDWAIENGIIEKRLDNIKIRREFERTRDKIETLKIFKERNIKGHNMYKCSLDKYEEYLKQYDKN